MRPGADHIARLRAWAPGLAPTLILALYALITLYVGARHEAWSDEAQAWLIGRDATPWQIVSRYGRYEGTPPLWHLLLWALAHLGYAYRYLWLVSGALALVGAAAILLRSPFPLLMRCGIVLSYFFAYQYSVVARSYALDLALVPLLAMTFDKRLDRPLVYGGLLAALAGANTHAFLLAGVLGLEWGVAAIRAGRWKEPRILAGAALCGGLALAAVAATWPPKDVSFETHGIGLLTALRAALLMAEAFVERIDVWSPTEPTVSSRALGFGASLLLLLPSLALFARARTKALFLGAMGVFFAFSAAKYGEAWHAGILFLVWVLVLWISWDRRAELSARQRMALSASLAVILGVQAWFSAAAWSREVRAVYAPGREVAKALADYREKTPDARIAAFGLNNFAVQPWARANLFDNYNGGAPRPAFFDWRTSQPFTRRPTLSAWREAVRPSGPDVLLLSNLGEMTEADRARYDAVAAEAGFCARAYPGGMIWKTYDHESLGVAMFTRCEAKSPASGGR